MARCRPRALHAGNGSGPRACSALSQSVRVQSADGLEIHGRPWRVGMRADRWCNEERLEGGPRGGWRLSLLTIAIPRRAADGQDEQEEGGPEGGYGEKEYQAILQILDQLYAE